MEDELSRLRRLYEEEKRLREEERQHHEEERQHHEEERQHHEEERQRHKEERQRHEEERQRHEEERRRLEVAEELVQDARPQTLEQYLAGCHSLQLSIHVVISPTKTTKGVPTDPSNRIFPRRIVPWGDDFVSQQKTIWNQLDGSLFSSQAAFPSKHNLQYVKSYLRPISSEVGLRYFERDVVENPVQTLVDNIHKDSMLRDSLGLRGTVEFESHTNLGQPSDESAAHRKARGKGNRADQYCIYRASSGDLVPALAIEYKAPHKLSLGELAIGLESEIQPERDVINKNAEGFPFAAKCLAAAIITQLFSYMIGKGIQYGYVCTGEAFVFLYIPDHDPTMVYHSLCIPSLDAADDDDDDDDYDTRLYRTAAAQVLAFTLKAISVEPPPMSWHDMTTALDIWPVEYDDVLRDIPETERKQPRATPYKPQRWKNFKRSPIRTRSRCKPLDNDKAGNDKDDESSEEGPPSPSPSHPRRSARIRALKPPGTGSSKTPGSNRRGGHQPTQSAQRMITSRPFCTQNCLLGLVNDGPMDETCPNFEHHASKHIDQQEFQRLVREQLARDRGPDADCTPLYISGALGSLFKVCLSSHGYTLVAKGMENFDLSRLQHENKIYDRLQSIQGEHVPVCLGIVNLALPYYYDSGVFTHFMFLGWGGRSLAHGMTRPNKQDAIDTVAKAYKEIHKRGVLHVDAALRNILHNKLTGTFMVIDFERSKLESREALGPINMNADNRKRKRVASRQEQDAFTRELDSIVSAVSRMKTQ